MCISKWDRDVHIEMCGVSKPLIEFKKNRAYWRRHLYKQRKGRIDQDSEIEDAEANQQDAPIEGPSTNHAYADGDSSKVVPEIMKIFEDYLAQGAKRK